MENKPKYRSSGNIDGFVPRTAQNRHVGFVPARPAGVRHRGLPTRRPGFRPQTPRLNTGAMEGFTPRRTPSQIGGPSPLNHQPLELPPVSEPAHGSHAKPKAKEHRGRFSRLHNIHWRKVAKRSALVFGVLVVLCGGWLGWKIIHDTSKVFGGNGDLLGFLSATKLKCENRGRCNILLAGNSADDPGHDGANLTDSVMLISIDVRNNTAFMLSIPRDLWVNIPGNGYAKINEAYPDGQSENFSQAGYAKGGMGLLEEVVSQDLGIPVDYYGLIDYGAFRDGVNAVGGVQVDIQSSDPRGLYDPNTNLNLKNGIQMLNGQKALNLARARGDGYGSYGFPDSDFDRAANQRMLLISLKDKVFSTSTLANPLKLGQVFDAIGNNVHTDLSTGNIRRLYDVFKHINSSAIKSYGFNDVTLSDQQNVDLLSNYNAPNGESALIPAAGIGNYSQMQLFLQQITSNNPVVKEAANVVVLNGGNTSGLAAAEGAVLTKQGMDVGTTSNAPATQATNTIINNSGGKDPATLAALEKLFGTNVGTNATLTSSYPNAAFIVMLGESQAMPQQ